MVRDSRGEQWPEILAIHLDPENPVWNHCFFVDLALKHGYHTIMEPKYLRDWQKRLAKQKSLDIESAKQALEKLPEAVAILKRHGATKILLFGSLCNEDRFRSRSDIDLAVSGIRPEVFCRAHADLLMNLDWPIDLKPLEELEKGFRMRILEQGRVIYAE